MNSSVNASLYPTGTSQYLHNTQASDFKEACKNAVSETTIAICSPIIEDLNFTSSASIDEHDSDSDETTMPGIRLPSRIFFDKHVTEQGRKEIRDLDETTRVFFKIILSGALSNMMPTWEKELRKMASQAGNQKWAAEYVQQKALPIIQSIITEFEEKWPGIIKQETQGGLSEEAKKTLDLFEI